MTDLKRCPFDGGEAALSGASDDERNGYAYHATVSCQTCGGSFVAHSYSDKNGWNVEGSGPAKRRAVEGWNARFSPTIKEDGK